MGADAYRQLSVYRAEVDKCADAFVAAGAESPLTYLVDNLEPGASSQIQIQAAQFTHAAGLAQVWRSCGIEPGITVGHSLGEVAAAYTAEAITLADGVAVVIARAKVVDALPGHYGMAVLGISADEAEKLIAKTSGWLELSVVNANTSVVVSGDRDAIATMVTAAEEQGMFAREIAVNFPAHTSALDALHSELRTLLPRGQFTDAAVQFIGSVTGDVVAPGTDFADYWYRNLRNTVRFDRAVAAALRHGAGSFVELSAHPALLFALGDILGDGEGESPLAVGSGRRDEQLVDVLSANIAAAAVTDPGYRWADLVEDHCPPLRGFPNAPMRAVHLWATPEPLPPVPGLMVADERWEPSVESVKRISVRSVAVVDLGAPTGPLADQLRSAVEVHAGVQPARARDADMIIAIAPVLDHPDIEQAAKEISRLIGAGLFDYVDTVGPNCADVWLITVGGEHVRADEPVALPAQAALAAMHRSVGFEHADQSFRHLDLPSWEIDDTTATAVIDTLLGDAKEAALRDDASGPMRYVRSLSDVDAPPPPWQLEGLLDNVVITGGSGAVGLHYARYLADQGARRLVLLSRSGVDPATVAELAGRRGAEVLAPQCDLTSAEAVCAAATQHAGDGASLVVHTAAAATFAVHHALSPEEFARTVAAKVSGLARLTELWPLRPDARILVCSSVSGVWGGRRARRVLGGQPDARRDGGPAARRGAALCGRAVGALAGARLDTSASPTPTRWRRSRRSGLLPMAPDIAIEASLRDHRGDPLILAADRNRLRTAFESRDAHGAERSATTTPIDIIALVRAELAAALNLGDAAAVDLDTSLLDLGVDSLLALDLRKRLRKATGKSVPLAALLGGITGGELIASLDDQERSEKVETTRD